MAILSNSELAPLLAGNTHYVTLDSGPGGGPGAGGEAVIHYGADQSSHMRLPGGQQLTGRWSLIEDGYHVSWQDGPSGDWFIDHAPGCFAYLDQSRERRGEISRIVPGDPEGFAA